MHWQVLTALMVSSWAKISKFNGSTAKEQCSESSRIFSGSMSVSRSTLLTKVKEDGREINESSWSKLMIFCLDIDNINQSSYYLPVYLWGQIMKSEKKIYFRGTISSLFNAAISCSDYTKKKNQRKANSFFLCVQTCRRSLTSATGRFSRRSRIAACTITSAWVSISPKASASNITSFITCLRSTTALPKITEYTNSKNTTENTIVCSTIKYFYTKKLQKIWHYEFLIAHVPFHQFCVKFTFTFPHFLLKKEKTT